MQHNFGERCACGFPFVHRSKDYLLNSAARFMGQTMGKLSYLFAAALTACAANAFAASVADVYQAALENDPVLGAAKQNYAARSEIVPQARAGLLPTISLNGSTAYNRLEYPDGQYIETNPSSPNFGQLRGIPGQEFNTHTWQAQLVQPIVDVAAYYTFRSAAALKSQAKQDYTASEQNLIVRTVAAYLDVLRSQAVLDSTNAEEAAVKRQQEQVQQRFDVGLVAITDVLDATAAYDNVVVRRIQAERDQGIQFETLFTLTGASYAEVDRISRDLPIVNPTSVDENEWVAIALANNPNVLASRDAKLAAERDLRARQAGHLPTVDAVASYNENVNQYNQLLGGQRFLGDQTNTRVYGLQLQLPIYQGGYTTSKVREARARLLQSGELVRNNEWAVSRDTRNLLRAVTTDVIRVQARIKSIKSSESALEATQTGYEVGTRNIVDVLQAQQRLYLSQFDYADSRYNYVRDLLLLKQSAGTLNNDDVVKLNSYTDPQQPVRRINTVSESAAQ
jgi:outer membrane protein